METWTLVFSGIAAFGALGAIITGIATWAYAHRSSERETERRDIVWRPLRTEEGFAFAHESHTPASDVLVVLMVSGETRTARKDAVLRDGSINVVSQEVQDRVDRSVAADAAYERELKDAEEPRADPGPAWMPNPLASLPRRVVMPPMSVPTTLRAVIVWRYPSGASDRQELVWAESF